MKRFLFGACGALLALGFSACNDETTTVSATSDAEKVSSFKDLDECGSSIVGKLVYVKDSVKAFICTDEGWAAMSAPVKNDSDDKVESSCTVQSIAGGYKVLCDGDSIGVLMNGTKGDSGVQGIQGVQGETGKSAYELSGTDKTLEEWLASLKGDNGKSCTTKKITDGIEVTCPDSEPVVIKNGTPGASGKNAYELSGTDKTLEEWLASLNGEDGKSCSTKEVLDGIEVTCPGSEPVTIKNGAAGSNCIIDSDKDGKVVLKCGEGENAVITTLYKAMCDVTPYDPAEKFCHDLRLYDKCGSPKVAYNIDKQFCAKFEDKTEQLYRYVTIAPKGKKYSKTWMAENLNYESAAGSYCYGDSAANCAKYGRLYTWAAAVNKSESECGYGHECNLGTGFVRGVCPEGWHLPSLDEWNALIAAVDTTISAYSTSNVAGTSLKSTSGWNDYHNNTGNGKDAYAFSALPAGLRAGSGVYANKGFRTCFWSSSTKNEHSAYHMDLDVKNEYYDDGIALLGYLSKDNGFSIRCVKD